MSAGLFARLRARVRIHLGIAAKIAFWAIVIGAVTAASASYFMYRGSVDILVDRAQESLSSSVDLAASRVATRFDSAERDLIFLSRTPAIAELAHVRPASPLPSDDTTAATAREDVSTLLTALLDARPGYFQARFVDATGKEIVRIARSTAGEISRAVEADLQDEANQPYFTDTAKLPAGSIYVSRIDLNQEHGAIEMPRRPTARVATPLYDAANRFTGMLVLNLDLNGLFALVDQTIGRSSEHFISNNTGDYLLNPDATKAFGFETGQQFCLQDDFPEFARSSAAPYPASSARSATMVSTTSPLPNASRSTPPGATGLSWSPRLRRTRHCSPAPGSWRRPRR